MKEEHSAGGLIIKKVNGQWNILLIMDMNGNWTFPKGLLEVGENSETAARREIKEEVGIASLQNASPLKQITYWYVRGGEKIHKKVDYFLFESVGDESLIPQIEEGISEVRWYHLTEAKRIIGYPDTNVSLIEQVQDTLTSL